MNPSKKGKRFNPQDFWDKFQNSLKKLTSDGLRPIVILYYVATDPDVPAWVKAIAVSALAYFILVTDAIPDFIPATGFLDDISVASSAIASISYWITDYHKKKADDVLDNWFD